MSYQDKVNHYVSQLDKELAKYPLLVKLEQQTGAPKAYVIGGLAYVTNFSRKPFIGRLES